MNVQLFPEVIERWQDALRVSLIEKNTMVDNKMSTVDDDKYINTFFEEFHPVQDAFMPKGLEDFITDYAKKNTEEIPQEKQFKRATEKLYCSSDPHKWQKSSNKEKSESFKGRSVHQTKKRLPNIVDLEAVVIKVDFNGNIKNCGAYSSIS
ncbi:hypothetical protein KEN49_CDS0275 [Pseudomonas phage vB_Pae3705-KEN49]